MSPKTIQRDPINHTIIYPKNSKDFKIHVQDIPNCKKIDTTSKSEVSAMRLCHLSGVVSGASGYSEVGWVDSVVPFVANCWLQ